MEEFRFNWKVILLCVCLFFFFLLVRFPFQNLRGYLFGKIYQNTRILIVADDIYLSFFGWPGLGIHNVAVTLPVGGSELDISSEKVIVRVGLAGIFPPTPSFSLAMRDLKKGGDLDLAFSQKANQMSASVEADDLQLEQLRFSALPNAILGKLNAEGDVDVDTTDISKSTGEIELDVTNLKLPPFNIQLSPAYGFVIPAMKVGALKARIRIRNGLAEIATFQLGGEGSDIKGSMTGDIKLGRTLMSAAANIIIRLEFSDNIKKSSQAETLLSFLNTFKSEKTGNYAIKCVRPFAEVAACLLLPEKVPD